MLLAKGNVHDGVSREMLYAAGAVTAAGSTLSFVRNRALLPRMLSVSLSLSAGAHLRVACNGAGGRVLSTAEEYAAAGFGDAGSIDFVGCDACDRDTYCYAPGTASASMKNGVCVCLCGSGGYGEACVPVGAPALPPAVGTAPSVFVREGVTVRSVFVVLDGVSTVLYVPWMARDGADRCAERVAAERSCAVRDGRWIVARCGCGGERRERAGGAVGVRCGGAERCACADRDFSRGVCADGDGLPAGCRDVDAACVSSRLAVLAVRTGAGAVGPAARAVRAGCVRRCPCDGDDWWADGGGGRRCAGACRWRC
ncbi:dispersed gene family protein 1 (DGF-1), putative, partial [Trypanosoma cruzi]